jgi:hypothetical protein
MQITTLFFIATMFIITSFVGILAMDNALSQPSQTMTTDTFGGQVSSATNNTQSVIVSTNAYEDRSQSLSAVMLAIFAIVCIILTFMALYRVRSPNYGKYRT